MKVEIQKIDKLKRIIKVKVSGEEFIKQRRDSYLETGKDLKVPGFRTANAPLEILEKYHANILKEEFLRKKLPLYYEQALRDNNLFAASLPRIYNVEYSPQELNFSAEFEVKPQLEIEESDYRGIKIKDKKTEVEEEEIKKIITNLKEGIKKIINKEVSDEELAKWASYPNVESFRKALNAQIYIEKLSERRRQVESQLTQHLLKNIKIDLPKAEVERCHNELVEREVHNLSLRNIPQDDIDKYRKDIEEKLRPLAEDEVKLFYIFEAIAAKEGLKAQNNFGETVLGFLLSLAHYE